MPTAWRFRSYVSEGADVIQVWHSTLPPEVQAWITGTIQYLQLQPIERWREREDDYKSLTGDLASLEELKFVYTEKVKRGRPAQEDHYRILGFADLEILEFTMLVGFKKTNPIGLDYQQHGPVALERMAQVRLNRKLYSAYSDWLTDV